MTDKPETALKGIITPMTGAALFAATLLTGIVLVVAGGLNLEGNGAVIYCVTTPCPQPDEPLWPRLMLGGGIGLLGVSAYLAYRLR